MNTSKTLPNVMYHTQSNFSKVPEITLLFWIIKILTTGMGEAASDYLSYRLLGPAIAAILFGGCLIVSLALQFTARRYVTWIYWLNVALISVFGTMVADGLHLGLNEIFAFWFAYIITRPLGASFADWMTSPSFRGGLGLNQVVVSLVLVAIIVALVIYMGINHLDIKKVNNERGGGSIRATRV